MRLDALTLCPECDDPLFGGAESTACPACGFEHDQRTVVFRPRRPGLVYLPVGVALVFAPSVYRVVDMLLHGAAPRIADVLFALTAIGLLAWMAPRWRCLAFGGRRYVSIGKVGVQARTTRGFQRIPWEDVAGLAVMFGVPILLRHDDSRPECRLEWIFDTDAEVAEFHQLVKSGPSYFGSSRSVSLLPPKTLPPPPSDRE